MRAAAVFQVAANIARLSLVLVALLSSIYCVLAYLPTTYFAYIRAPFQPWLVAFVHVQAYWFAGSLLATAAALVAQNRTSRGRRMSFEFLGAGVIAAIYALLARPVETIGNNSLSFVLSVAFVFPVIWLGIIDSVSLASYIDNRPRTWRGISFRRVALSAVFVALACPGMSHLRYYVAGMPSTLAASELLVWTWAAVSHVLFFLGVFSVVEICESLATRTANAPRTRFLVHLALSWLGTAIVFDKLALAAIPFEGREAQIYAVVLSLALVSVASGWWLRFRMRSRVAGQGAVGAEIRALRQRHFAALVLFLTAAALTVPALIGALDWNEVLEKLWSIVFCAMAAAVFVYARPLPARRRPLWQVVALAVLSLGLYRVGGASGVKWLRLLPIPHLDIEAAVAQHRYFDASFEAVSQLMDASRPHPCGPQCEFLKQQTNIPPSAELKLRDINLVENFTPAIGKQPNIFIVVVDTLRQDYVSAYNPAVTFTPAISTFARDSVVFRNAFTRYSGTTLSEPSIWSGTLQLHKHYVQPFHLVNNLEKLIRGDNYESFVTVDTTLSALLEPRADMVRLDESAAKWTDVDFCSTARDALRKMERRRDPRKPIFFFTQAQNIHIVTLVQNRSRRPPKKSYGKFFDLYASELERLDGCFGSFMQALKAGGLYDNSIIVLTSDHGEALREIGHPRHMFSLMPEVIRIPLIIHLPEAMKRAWYYDTGAVAFNTDVTASLYELLGHGPVISRPEFGRPLFTRTKEEMDKYRRETYLIASSYGPVYGLLYENGTKLFVEDESTSKEAFFDLARDPGAGNDLLTDAVRLRGESQLRSDLQSIAELYGYTYKPPTLIDWLMR